MITKRVAFIRCFSFRRTPGVIVKEFAISARSERQTRNAPMGHVVSTDDELDKLLTDAGLPVRPGTADFFDVSEEQLEKLGIDPGALD